MHAAMLEVPPREITPGPLKPMDERRFVDRDGTEWRVSWAPEATIVMEVGRRARVVPAGFLFACSALEFRVPAQHRVDPRAIPAARLQAMIDWKMQDDLGDF